jgi:GNAT superfamily N-acetyltransferase
MSFTIRSASETDALTLLNLIKELASYEKLSDQVVATEESLRYWLFEMKRAEALVFEVDHSIIGFALYFYNFSTFLGKAGLYLEDLYIQPDFRHKGYGKQVFKYLAKLTLDKGCGRMEWSVLDWNTPSIKFYKQLGAISMDDWTSYRLTEKELIRLVE